MDTEQLNAGPELDRLIARKIMGWQEPGLWRKMKLAMANRHDLCLPPKYSVDITEAVNVMVSLHRSGNCISLGIRSCIDGSCIDGSWTMEYNHRYRSGLEKRFTGTSYSPALAICRAVAEFLTHTATVTDCG